MPNGGCDAASSVFTGGIDNSEREVFIQSLANLLAFFTNSVSVKAIYYFKAPSFPPGHDRLGVPVLFDGRL